MRRFGRGPNRIETGNPDACPDGRDGLRPFGESPALARRNRIERETMAQTFTGRKRVRKFFGKIKEVAEMPNLIEVQKASYDQFLLVKEPAGRPSRRGPAGGLQIGVPDLRLLQHLAARVRQLRIRAAEIRRRRVPPARHDLCRAAQGDAAADRVRYRRGDRRALGQGHQGAGCLHGRHSAHDQQRHLHRQRHRARHRFADAPFARRVLRSRQGQDAFLGQAAVRRPHHSVSRLLARHRVRRQGHRAMRASTAAARFR